MIGGALADVYGKARILAIGQRSASDSRRSACALAPSVEWLIAARVAQGAAAAIFTPASLALIGATYPKDERNRAIGVWAAASALTTAGGPVLGGWLTESPSAGRAVFWINPPIALVAVGMLAALSRPKTGASGAPSIYPAPRSSPRRLCALAWALSRIGPQARRMRPAARASSSATAIAVVLGVGGLRRLCVLGTGKPASR